MDLKAETKSLNRLNAQTNKVWPSAAHKKQILSRNAQLEDIRWSVL